MVTSKSKSPRKKVHGVNAGRVADGSGVAGVLRLTFYIVLLAFLTLYGTYVLYPDDFQDVTDKYEFLQPVLNLFKAIEIYSPFHEFLNDIGTGETDTPPKHVIMTKEELKVYDGSVPGKGPYLAVLGQIFDVSKGRDHYGPGGGYAFFSGTDGSRAFVTGQFDTDGLVDDVSDLSYGDYLGLKEWLDFYHKVRCM